MVLFKRRTSPFVVQSIPQRYVLAVMTALALNTVYMARVLLAISLTQMVKPIVVANTTATNEDFSCPMPNANQNVYRNYSELTIENSLMPNDAQLFDWSQELQGYILSTFYIGYAMMHMPCGLLSQRYGGKPLLSLVIFLSGTLSIATPLAVAYGGPYGLMLVRFLLGSVQAGLYPSIATLLAAWIPKIERGRIGSMVYCAAPGGTIVGNFAAGMLMHHFKTWQVGFYAFGGINVVLGVLYVFLCTSNPASHPFITDDEKNYLQTEIGQLEKDKSQKKIPWKSLLTSSPVIALAFTIVFGDWAYYTILIDLPKYMNDVIHVTIKDNGIFSSLPWIMYIILAVISGAWSDRLVSSGRLSITNVRKLLVSLASVTAAIFIIAAAYGGCNVNIVGVLFTFAIGGRGFLSASIFLNAMDLCPNYAGILTGVIGSLACCVGALVPVAVSYLTPNSLQSEWRIVFWITCITSMVQLVVFDIWGSAKVLPWNNPNTCESVKVQTACHANEVQTYKSKTNDDAQ